MFLGDELFDVLVELLIVHPASVPVSSGDEPRAGRQAPSRWSVHAPGTRPGRPGEDDPVPGLETGVVDLGGNPREMVCRPAAQQAREWDQPAI